MRNRIKSRENQQLKSQRMCAIPERLIPRESTALDSLSISAGHTALEWRHGGIHHRPANIFDCSRTCKRDVRSICANFIFCASTATTDDVYAREYRSRNAQLDANGGQLKLRCFNEAILNGSLRPGPSRPDRRLPNRSGSRQHNLDGHPRRAAQFHLLLQIAVID